MTLDPIQRLLDEHGWAEGTPVDELLCGLNQAMLSEPPAWLAKHLKTADHGRFEAMDAEGWSE